MTPTTESRPVTLYLGLALTALAALAPLVDAATAGAIADHVRAAYPEWPAGDVRLERNAIAGWLAVTNALGIPLWLWTIRLTGQGRRRARTVAAWSFAAGACLALLNLGYGGEQYTTVVPLTFGLIGLMPAVVGLVALVAVWRKRPALEEAR